MRTLPKFKPGQTLGDMSATELRSMVEMLHWMYRQMQADRTVVDRLRTHPAIRGSVGLPPKVVVIVDTVKGARSGGAWSDPPRLRCKEVKYRDAWPDPCETVEGQEMCHLLLDDVMQDMHVWPGKMVEDYEGDVFSGESDDLKPDTAYFTSHWVQGRWIVEKPQASSSVRSVVVLGGRRETGFSPFFGSQPPEEDPPLPLTTFELWVQEVSKSGTPVAWRAKGEPFRAATMPQIPGNLYEQFTLDDGNVLPATNRTVILRLEKIDGVWTVDQRLPWEVLARPTGVTGECNVT